MKILDKNGDGHIDVTEFLVAVRVSGFKRQGSCQAEPATAEFKTKAN